MLLARFDKKFPTLINALKHARLNGRMAHAYLVQSDSPEIRKEFPVVLSQIAVCPQVSSDGSPCGACPACVKLENGTYPEMYSLSPAGKMRIIPVGSTKNPEPDTVRWFEDLFYLTSTGTESKKIGIINDADRMRQDAQNIFLKTLEEPPPDSFFILSTGNASSLLPTTRSRCQTLLLLENRCSYDFSGAEELFDALNELFFRCRGSLPLAEEQAERIIGIANELNTEAEERLAGEWDDVMSDSDLEKADRKRFEDLYKGAVSSEYLYLRSYFLSAIHSWFAQLYQLSCGIPAGELSNPEIFSGFDVKGSEIDGKAAFKAMEKCEQLIFEMNFNVDEELALRSFCLNISI